MIYLNKNTHGYSPYIMSKLRRDKKNIDLYSHWMVKNILRYRILKKEKIKNALAARCAALSATGCVLVITNTINPARYLVILN